MVDKITLSDVTTFQNDGTAVAAVNNNNAAIITAMNNTLSRDGTSPNQMGANLDMNNNNIINLPPPTTINSPARLVDVATNPTVVVPPTGTSGHVVPFLDGNNTFSGSNTFGVLPGSPIFTGSPQISVPGANSSALTINNGDAVHNSEIVFAAANAGKWEVGKDAAGNFFIFDDVGSRSVVTAAPNTGANILGTRTNDNATTGFVGEFVTSSVANSSVSIVTSVAKTVTSISLTAGDWELTGSVGITPAGTTTVSQIAGCYSLTTNAFNAIEGNNFFNMFSNFPTGITQTMPIPSNRVSLSGTTTVFLIIQVAFAVSTCTAGGTIRARRVR